LRAATTSAVMSKDNPFKRSLLDPNEFTITYELVPGQGFGGKQLDSLLSFADKAQADGRIKALSITDNPGSTPALAPMAIGSEILQMGIEPLIHFSLKDKNRNQVESHIFLYQRLQLHSLLVLGGDFPKQGYYGQAKPVFDLDTIQTLQLMRDMENGCYRSRSKNKQPAPPMPPLFKGCVVSPFKATEAEQVWQYAKLLYKVRAGADFIITQLGFDMRKFKEMVLFLKQQGIDLPVLANVFIPSLPVARAMAAGRVPGVLLSEDLVASMAREAEQGNSRARLDRAAAMIVTLKRLGYQGVHIGGNNLTFMDLSFVMDRVEEMEERAEPLWEDNDFPVKDCWYYYRPAPTGQAESGQAALRPGSRPGAVKLQLLTHHLLFSEQTFSGRLFGKFCRFCARDKFRTDILCAVERSIKRLLFNCRMCGTCTLDRAAYLCPQAGCPKRLVNGPCGGSRKGFCEVYPERRCFWGRIYERLDPQTTVSTLAAPRHLTPKDWALEKTSSWINHFKSS